MSKAQFERCGAEYVYYDEKQEKKRKRAGNVLLGILLARLLLCLVMTIYLSANDLNYYINGTKQTVQCVPGHHTTTYTAPDEKIYIVDIFWSFTDQSEIDIYYLGQDYSHAIAMTNYVLWIIFYGVFGGLFLIVAIALKKGIRPKKHTDVKRSGK